jgi:hypothetical protein
MDRPILKIESGQAPKPKEETNFERTIRLLQERGASLPIPGTTGGGMAAGMPTPTPRGGISPLAPEEIVTRPFGSETWSGRKDYPSAEARLIDEQRLQQARALQESPPVEGRTVEDLLAMFSGGGGGGVVRPDYSAYRQAITDQAQQLNAQIQAMYNQLAGQAGENVGRIQDIYGGATAGIEAGYGSAAENIAQAYESAQQQAAEQMARLGIEEAAQQVLPSQALSQAEAVAGLEAGRAGGLSAAERYGASGAQFGSEMAQVAQQQGTEMNAAILAALQNRLNESLLAEAQGAVSGGGGRAADPISSAMDFLRLEQMLAEPEREAFETALADQRAAQEAQATLQYRASQLALDLAPQGANEEEMAQAYQLALSMLGG